jgi:hypothetical protein
MHSAAPAQLLANSLHLQLQQCPHHNTLPAPCPRPQVSPVHQGLEDRHPHPRRTAVMGVLKIYHLNSDMVDHTGAGWAGGRQRSRRLGHGWAWAVLNR